MGETVFSVLLRELKTDAEELSQFLARGGAADFAAYNRMVGKYQALKLFEDRVKELEAHHIGD
jgi:hypothetical protein